MRWMWSGIGLAAAALAVLIIWVWNRRVCGKPRREVSVLAQIERIGQTEGGRQRLEFVDQKRHHYSFAVPERMAQQLSVGQQGVLTFCEDEFVHFVRQEVLLPNQQGGRPLWVS